MDKNPSVFHNSLHRKFYALPVQKFIISFLKLRETIFVEQYSSYNMMSFSGGQDGGPDSSSGFELPLLSEKLGVHIPSCAAARRHKQEALEMVL